MELPGKRLNMSPIHEQLAAERWQRLSLMEPFILALELLDLTIADERWKGPRKELTSVREMLCDTRCGGSAYLNNLAGLDRYFFHFAVAARAGH